MGWLWSSRKDPSTVTPPSQDNTSPESSDPPPPDQKSDDSTNAELHALLDSAHPTSPPSQPTSNPRQPLHDPPTAPSHLITPSTTLPSTLSCRSAFDAAFYCQSFGGQFVNVYRYGSLRGCSEQWEDFWFCVRTNRGFMNEERRKETVRAWALNKEREKYGGGRRVGKGVGEGEGGGDGMEKMSSEDVWEARRWKVRGAFEGDWGILEREARERAELEMQEEVR